MKNLFSVSAVFDAREYLGSSVEASFPYTYTFLLSQGEFITSALYLPKQLTFPKMFAHGIGYSTRAEAEDWRGKIVEALADVELMAIVYRANGVLLDGASVIFDRPGDALTYIRDLEKDVPVPMGYCGTANFTTTNNLGSNHYGVGHMLHFDFPVSKCSEHRIQLTRYFPASSTATPLLNWDAIGIK